MPCSRFQSLLFTSLSRHTVLQMPAVASGLYALAQVAMRSYNKNQINAIQAIPRTGGAKRGRCQVDAHTAVLRPRGVGGMAGCNPSPDGQPGGAYTHAANPAPIPLNEWTAVAVAPPPAGCMARRHGLA